jgi:hypothetical protein
MTLTLYLYTECQPLYVGLGGEHYAHSLFTLVLCKTGLRITVKITYTHIARLVGILKIANRRCPY